VKSCIDTSIALCELGASTTRGDSRGDTPLHMAVATDLPVMVLYLLEKHNVPVNTPNRHGMTPLHMAISEEVANILLKHGASIIAVTSTQKREVPIHSAASGGYAGVVKALLDFADQNESIIKNYVNIRMNNNATPIIAAAIGGSAEVVKLLIERGAVFDPPIRDLSTPLVAACRAGNAKVQIPLPPISCPLDLFLFLGCANIIGGWSGSYL